MPVSVITNFKSTWNASAVTPLLFKELETRMEMTMEVLKTHAKEHAPVDRGDLRDSIRTWGPEWDARDVLHGKVGVPMEYNGHSMDYGYYQEVGFIHAGTGQKIQNAYLIPAIRTGRAEIQSIWATPWRG